MDGPAIQILSTSDCPHAQPTSELVQTVVAELSCASTITQTEVKDAAHALELGFPGSPTIRINGQDIEGVVPATGTFT